MVSRDVFSLGKMRPRVPLGMFGTPSRRASPAFPELQAGSLIRKWAKHSASPSNAIPYTGLAVPPSSSARIGRCTEVRAAHRWVTPDRRACTSTSGLKLHGARNPRPAAVIYLLALVVSAGRSVPLRLFETLCQTSEGGRPKLADGAAFKLDVIRDLTDAAARLSVQRKAGEHTPFVSRYDIAD